MKSHFVAAAGAALLTAAPAFAQDNVPFVNDVGLYGSIGLSHFGVDDYHIPAATIRGGLRINNYFGIEGEFSKGVRSDEVSDNAAAGEIALSHAYGIYLVGFAPANDTFDLFGRVGFGNSEAEVTNAVVPARISEDRTSVNYGVGIQWFPDTVNGVRLEYTRWDNLDDTDEATPPGTGRPGGDDLNMFTVSYVRRFR